MRNKYLAYVKKKGWLSKLPFCLALYLNDKLLRIRMREIYQETCRVYLDEYPEQAKLREEYFVSRHLENLTIQEIAVQDFIRACKFAGLIDVNFVKSASTIATINGSPAKYDENGFYTTAYLRQTFGESPALKALSEIKLNKFLAKRFLERN